jgi:hypothetical protein
MPIGFVRTEENTEDNWIEELIQHISFMFRYQMYSMCKCC